MKYAIPLAAMTAALAVAAGVQMMPGASSGTSSSSSDSTSTASASSSSSSPDCPAKPGAPTPPIRHDPTGRTTSSCFSPYVKQPGATAASSSSAPR